MRDASSYSASEIWTEDQSNIADKLLRYYGTHTDVTVDDLTEHFLEQNPGHSRPLIEETWTQNASLSSLFRNCRDTKLSSHTSLGQNTTRYILGAYKFHRSHSRRLDCSRRRAQEFYNSRYYPSQHRRTLGSQLSSPTDAYQGLLPTTRSSAKQKNVLDYEDTTSTSSTATTHTNIHPVHLGIQILVSLRPDTQQRRGCISAAMIFCTRS